MRMYHELHLLCQFVPTFSTSITLSQRQLQHARNFQQRRDDRYNSAISVLTASDPTAATADASDDEINAIFASSSQPERERPPRRQATTAATAAIAAMSSDDKHNDTAMWDASSAAVADDEYNPAHHNANDTDSAIILQRLQSSRGDEPRAADNFRRRLQTSIKSVGDVGSIFF